MHAPNPGRIYAGKHECRSGGAWENILLLLKKYGANHPHIYTGSEYYLDY